MSSSRSRLKRWRWLAAGMALMLVGAACGDDDDEGAATGTDSGEEQTGGTVTISGPETGSEADGLTESFEPFTADEGIEVEYTGTRDFETQIRVAAEGGDLPDLAMIPQPGLIRDLAEQITPVPQETLDAHQEQFDEGLLELGTVDGEVLGLPVKGDVKSLVWYSPKVFAENGYEVPETWDDLIALQDQMKADDITPWCIGIESGDATGWPMTDWMEDLMLRLHGPDVYDQWVSHEIPFNDPKVKEAAEMLEEVWFAEGNVLNGRQSIASTGFQQAGLPVADGQCGMHRQANFYGAQFKDQNPDAVFGEDGDINVFYLPTINDDFGKVTLVGGIFVVAFNDEPATLATLEYLASPESANARIETNKGGFLSPNKEHDTALYSDELDSTLAEILVNADPARFDGSDAMPSEVGSGSFWKEGTNWVLGSTSLDDFLDNVESSWPS